MLLRVVLFQFPLVFLGLTYLLNYLLTYLLTHSIVQSPS